MGEPDRLCPTPTRLHAVTHRYRGDDLACTGPMIKVYSAHLPKSNQGLCWLRQLAGDKRRGTGRWWRWGGWGWRAPSLVEVTLVVPWQGGRKLQPRGGSSSALLSTPLWPDGVNQSSPKMSASAQAISDWNKWQMGMLFPLFNQFHQMWFYLL